MENVKANKFVLFVAWWSVEVEANCVVNDIPETFSSVRFRFEIGKVECLILCTPCQILCR